MGERVKIQVDGQSVEVEVNGKRLENSIMSYTIRHDPGRRPIVRFELATPGLIFDGSADVDIQPQLRAALLDLGWTAPHDE